MDKFIAEHSVLFYLATIVLVGIVAWFIRSYFKGNIEALKEIKVSIADLYDKWNDSTEKVGKISERLSHIEGEHEAYTSFKGIHNKTKGG